MWRTASISGQIINEKAANLVIGLSTPAHFCPASDTRSDREEKNLVFPQGVYRMLALAHHYRSWRGSPDHTVRPGSYLHLSEAIVKDLNLIYSLVSADFKAVPAILFPSLSNTTRSLAGCPSSANSSRSWKGVEDGEESYCMVCKYRTQQGEDMPSDGDKAVTFIAVKEGITWRACLCDEYWCRWFEGVKVAH